MPVPCGWIACGWHAQSTPFPCRCRLESGRWNPNVPPCRLGGAPYAALRRSRLCPQTSSRDRFALATRRFRFASCLRSACDRRCRFPSHTNESPFRSRPVTGCTTSGTTYTYHPFPEPVPRFRRERCRRELCNVFREVSERRRDGKRAPKNCRFARRPETVRCTQAPRDLHKRSEEHTSELQSHHDL